MMLSKVRRIGGKGLRFAKRQYVAGREMLSYFSNKNLFVFGAPYHSNAGDQAQTYCIEKWAKENYPGYTVRIFDTRKITNNQNILRRIRKCIKREDKIFLHSGYHTTDLYMYEENMQRRVVELFPDHQVVMLPQTIFYQNMEEAKKAEEIYNSHPDLMILCRDEVSYNTANEIFPKAKKSLFPDIVTTLIGSYRYNYVRKGILICTRNDKEGLVTSEEKERLIEQLSMIDTVDQTDTTLPIDANYFSLHRKEILEKEWDKYAHYKVVITDRYHGTIFSLIANTPVIVMPSTDHKLESGVKWFPESYKDYVTYCPDSKMIPDVVKAYYERKMDYNIPELFQTEYYSKLRSLIEEQTK